MAMKLYLLRSREDLPARGWPFGGYDTFNGFVVRAESEVAARQLVTSETHGSEQSDCPDAWTNPKWSTCKELLPEGPSGIVLFNYTDG